MPTGKAHVRAVPFPKLSGQVTPWAACAQNPEDLKPCTQGIPCTECHINWFGFVTIPLLSALAFLLITVLLNLAYKRSSP